MNGVKQEIPITGVYLIDSCLKDTRLVITGYDFTTNLKDNAKFIVGLRIASIAFRVLGSVLGSCCVTYVFNGNLLFAVPLFIVSHDCIVLGNNISNGVKIFIDDVLKWEFFNGVKKLANIAWNRINDIKGLEKDLEEVGFEAILKDVKSGTIMEGWKETYSVLTAS